MGGLYEEAFVERLRREAQALAPQWGLSPRTEMRLLTVSENATFRAQDPTRAEAIILRVHRPRYHTRVEIESELAWLQDLAATRVAPVARPLQTRSGELIAEFDLDGAPRQVVAFEFLPGVEPSPETDLVAAFHELGGLTARLHAHARAWLRPTWFRRKVWDVEAAIGRSAHWGDWRDALGLTPAGGELLERVATTLEQRLGAYGYGSDRFGLIHADLRLANLLVDDGRISVIDFDDCGFGWFVFDFAAAVSFIEHDPSLPLWKAAWLNGYRAEAPLSDEAAGLIPSLVMLRRIQLTAWIASHSETPTAQELGAPFTLGTLAIAEAYLSGGFLASETS